jgi:ketosteroid isomerase-like protein
MADCSGDTERAMSEENVDVVRSGFEAWNAGDMDALRELHDANVIMRPAEGWPEPGPFEGREACMRWYEQLREAFDINAGKLISVADADDHVVATFLWHGMGRGPESNMEFTGVYTVRRGKVVLVEYFWDHDEALETAGLRE